MREIKSIFQELLEERRRQDAKWGVQNHKPVVWLSILMEEVGEAAKEAFEAQQYFHENYDDKLRNYRAELIQVAAVCVAMIESLERNNPNTNFKRR